MTNRWRSRKRIAAGVVESSFETAGYEEFATAVIVPMLQPNRASLATTLRYFKPRITSQLRPSQRGWGTNARNTTSFETCFQEKNPQ